MSNKKKNGQNMLQWLIPTAVLVIIILFTLTSYKTDIFTKEKNKRLDEYSSKAREMADYYSSEIYMIGQVARMLSTRVSVERDYFCDDNVDLLTSAVTQLNIDAGYILRNDGRVMNDKGVEAPNLKTATNGDINIETGNVENYIVTSNGDCVHYASASFAEGSVILKYTPKKISDLELFLSSNAKTSTYLLISSTGIILDSAGVESKVFKEGVDLFEYLDGASYAGITKKDEFLKNLEQQNKGKVLITNKEGVPKYYIYQPIGEHKTFVMIVVDESQVQDAARKGIASTTEMFWKIVILILVFVAILLVISIINAANFRKSNRELKEQAETDLLTDLYNKVATETKIKEYLAGEGKNKKAIMFVLDIDNFKKINDTMGHAFGDEVLSTLGRQLKSEFRVNDIIGRTGGDEFIILLKDLKDDAALKREASRVETFFKNFKVGEYTKYSATASIGAVLIPDDGSEFETLYKHADKALYLAKKRGKNQMSFYADTKDIVIEPEKPILKVVEEVPRPGDEPKKVVEPEVKQETKPETEPEVKTEAKTEEKPEVKAEAAKIEEKPSEKPETEKKSENETEKKEADKAIPTMKEVFSGGDQESKEEKPEAVTKEVSKSDEDKQEVSKPESVEAAKPVEDVKSAETPKEAVKAEPQKKVVKKVVKRVVKKPVEEAAAPKPAVASKEAVKPVNVPKKTEAPKPAVKPEAAQKPSEAPKPAQAATGAVTTTKVVKKVVKKVQSPTEAQKKTEAPKPAQAPKKAEVSKPAQTAQAPKKAEAPKPVQAPKKAEAPKPAQTAQTPKKAEAPKPAQTPKKAEAPKPAQAPKKAEPPKPVEAPKKAEPPKPVEAPKKEEAPKPVETPAEASSEPPKVHPREDGKFSFFT